MKIYKKLIWAISVVEGCQNVFFFFFFFALWHFFFILYFSNTRYVGISLCLVLNFREFLTLNVTIPITIGKKRTWVNLSDPITICCVCAVFIFFSFFYWIIIFVLIGSDVISFLFYLGISVAFDLLITIVKKDV